MIIFQLASAA